MTVRTLQDRLTDEALRLRERARFVPPGAEQEALLDKARENEGAMRLPEWLMSLLDAQQVESSDQATETPDTGED